MMAGRRFAGVCLALGICVLAVAWLGPLPALAARYFTGHMTMHLLVLAVATPLLGFGLTRLSGSRFKLTRHLAAVAVPASVLELLIVWTWHSPDMHTFARQTSAGLFLEQASFLVAGLLLWTAALQPKSADGANVGASILSLLLTSVHMTLLGALIALAPRPLYICYANAAGNGTVPQADLLGDQHLGGAMMIVAAGSVYLVAGLVRLKEFLDADRTVYASN